MLTKWTLANFKAISNKTTLTLSPITILVGENSSGKSTILQSILLIAQTLKATQSRQPLLFNGEFIRLGYLADIVHNGQKNIPLEIGFELQPEDPIYAVISNKFQKRHPIELQLQINSPAADRSPNSEGILGHLDLRSGDEDALVLEHTFGQTETALDPNENKNFQIPTELRSEIQSGNFNTTIKHIRFSQGEWLYKIDPYEFHASLYHFLPNKILESYNAVHYSLAVALKAAGDYLRFKSTRRDIISEISSVPPLNVTNFRDRLGGLLRKEINDAIYSNIPTGKKFESGVSGSSVQYLRMAVDYLEKYQTLDTWLYQVKLDIPLQHARVIGDRLIHRSTLLERRVGEADSFTSEIGLRVANLPQSIEDIKSRVTNFFSQYVYYLGPLREDPRFIYSLPPYPELTHVGLKGEFTPSVLERFKDKEVEYPLPPTANGKFSQIGKAKLIDALSQWLEYMGLLEKVNTKDRGKIGTELSVHYAGVKQELDLTSIGVGVSQVLPTLVMGLIAPPGTAFLLEQPELHLHPKVQSMVADFLLGLTMIGKQCIVETHSEYLVNRLRRRVAEDDSDKLTEQVAIYFVERRDGKSNFIKLDLTQYGSLLSWPEGFFDEGPNEAELIMKAALKKRQSKQQPTISS